MKERDTLHKRQNWNNENEAINNPQSGNKVSKEAGRGIDKEDVLLEEGERDHVLQVASPEYLDFLVEKEEKRQKMEEEQAQLRLDARRLYSLYIGTTFGDDHTVQ